MCITFFCLYPFSSGEKQQQKQQVMEQTEGENKNKIKFVLSFNRDEQSHRQTLKMGPFAQDPNIYAGRDLKSTGTWLGINIKTGIMVVLTNYDLPVFRAGKSRGQLVKSFLLTQFVPEQMSNQQGLVNEKISGRLIDVLKESKSYSAFNLMVYNIKGDTIYYICSQTGMKQPAILNKSQIYGLCNTDLYTMWPKTKHGLKLFTQTLNEVKEKKEEEILDALIEKVMKDKVSFSQILEDQASIFLEPFYSTLQKAQRMTKSTFVALIKEVNEKQSQIILRQITHKNNNYQESKQKHINFDHAQETVTNLRFII